MNIAEQNSAELQDKKEKVVLSAEHDGCPRTAFCGVEPILVECK